MREEREERGERERREEMTVDYTKTPDLLIDD